MRRYWRVARTGLIDGWTQPHEFNVGMTYEDGTRASDRRQVLYDRASLLGQAAARGTLRVIKVLMRSMKQDQL